MKMKNVFDKVFGWVFLRRNTSYAIYRAMQKGIRKKREEVFKRRGGKNQTIFNKLSGGRI